jgi:anti-anti-sigma factor
VNLADVEIRSEDTVVIAQLTGEIDLANARGIEEEIIAATPNRARRVVVDLSALEFIDSAGIQLVYQLRERLHNRRQEMSLVIPPDSTAADALRLAGVMDRLSTAETVEEARG